MLIWISFVSIFITTYAISFDIIRAFTAINSGQNVKCDIASSFKCNSTKRCIPLSYVCDGDDDCGDFEDESNCTHKTCPPSQFLCGKTKACIPVQWVCDGDKDCGDYSDETHPNCTNKPTICTIDQFWCYRTNTCINIRLVCNGRNDCYNGEDEHNCTTSKSVVQSPSFIAITSSNESASSADGRLVATVNTTSGHCGADQFRCNNNRCIEKSWFCDDDDDCGDSSDEDSIMCNHTCKSGDFHCRIGRPRRCMPREWMCDGDADCDDGSDELNCENFVHTASCRPDDFRCNNGACIKLTFKCDGDYDCVDKSDEGQMCDKGCGSNQFKCLATRFCIDSKKRCDGYKDCADESDEHNCSIVSPTTARPVCPLASFLCRQNGHCLPPSKLCDGTVDCPDGSDESTLLANCTRALKPSHQCSSVGKQSSCPAYKACVQTAAGNRCACVPGYAVDPKNSTACTDINECSGELHKCSQICVNMPGTYRCLCEKGYLLSEDGRTCISIGYPPQLWITSKNHVRSVTIPRTGLPSGMPLLENLTFAVAMDYHYSRNIIAWSDFERRAIYTCDLANFTPFSTAKFSNCGHPLVTQNISDPNGLAIDWVHDLLYWTDASYDTIRVVNLLDGRFHKTLINTDLDEPRAIVVEPTKGLMFWTDWGKTPKIERAAMDGSQRVTILKDSSLVAWPNGLALDLIHKRIYFADAKLKHIMSMNYDGAEQRTVLKSWRDLEHPFGLTVFEDRVYWSDWESSGVHYANKFDGSSPSIVAKFVHGSTTIRVHHENAQPATINKCQDHGCEHICVPSSHRSDLLSDSFRIYTCLCADGYSMNSKGSCLAASTGISSNARINQSGAGSGGVGFVLALLICIASLSACVGWLVWKKHRRDDLNRWTFGGNLIFRSGSNAGGAAGVSQVHRLQPVDGVMESYDHLRLSFHDYDDVNRPYNDVVYRPTTTTSDHYQASGRVNLPGESSTVGGVVRSTAIDAPPSSLSLAPASAVVELVRKVVDAGRRPNASSADSMHLPLTEHMHDESNDFTANT